ncbi:ABC transporter permease [Sporomusa sphaeroides]|uniref:Dipeptide transport system permease protein DppB n=2 Tax=Sporomusa TaxID=2375 RepID=A0ABM9VZJ7_9FIRM|nr:ABC transporter permease [Sporomusa sphaeroides]OLS57121.1 dipeptide transport system permease protein DppB [Sporomusa sphaeroides DSM 2875]CVK18307.1 Dipeptide transport system permease protein DppB [Sporomusa sphaeroides DSM 2875]SCM81589.1 Binding-protein-dependent transporters inner membrane component [uncultured Sporomusa sp.]
MSTGTLKYWGMTLVRMTTLLIAISMVSFILIASSPIDPVDAYVGDLSVSEEQRNNIIAYWGLDKSPMERYLIWAGHLFEGDMGTSITYRQPVTEVIGERFKTSLALMGLAWVFSGIIGFLLGVVSGVRRGSGLDKAIKTFCLTLTATPIFWMGLLILMVFAVELQWFPLGLAAPIGKVAGEATLAERLYHLILPAFTLSITGVAPIALHTRQKIIDVMKSEYVLFARARGEKRWTAVRRHGIRNILLPAITLQFASFSELFGGSVLAEKVFSYPGLGNAATTAGLKGDMPLLLGVALFSAVFVFTGNFMANVIYGIVDPQIREGGKHG